MPRPLGSKNKSTLAKQAAEPSIATTRQDGYAETFALPPAQRRDMSSRAGTGFIVSQGEVLDAYMSVGMARRVVDLPAEEMTRAGFTLENVTDDLLDKVQARVEELDVLKKLNDAVAWSRLFGGSVIVLGINDARPLDVEANLEGARDLEFLRVYDRFQVSVKTWNEDATTKEYGEPLIWTVSPRGRTSQAYDVHNSRVLMFDGDSIPDLARNLNGGWGGSVIQACKTELDRLGMGHYWAQALLERSSQAVHGIPQLSRIMSTPNGGKLMQARADVVDMVRSIINTIIIDSDESYELKAASLAGIGDVLDRFAEALSAVTGIPIYLLMGRSPGGLNASGANNETAWHEKVASMQNDILRKPLDKIISLVFRSLSGNDGGAYKLVFNPLKTATAAEEGEIRKNEEEAEKARMETLSGYITAGIMDAKEARKIIADDYDLDTSLDIVDPVEKQLELEHEYAKDLQASKPAPAPVVSRGTIPK